MKTSRWLALAGAAILVSRGTAGAVPLTGRIVKGDVTKFGESWPTTSENGNSKVSISGDCAGAVPADLDLRTCDLVLDGMLFRIDPNASPTGELAFDASQRPVSAPGTLADDCACEADDSGCTELCDADEQPCLQACRGGKSSEVTFRSDQRARPTLKLRLKRREVNRQQRLEFSIALDRAVSGPGAWDSLSGTAFPPENHACLDTGFHVWCGSEKAKRLAFSCSASTDWRPTSSGSPAAYTALRTRGEVCSPPGCLTNADCSTGEYCARVDGACWAQGECSPRPGACPWFWEPVCGCDGRTHSNAACAAVAGTSIASDGPCP